MLSWFQLQNFKLPFIGYHSILVKASIRHSSENVKSDCENIVNAYFSNKTHV